MSCCAVALAQDMGQTSRFAQQQPLRGWLRAAQHADLSSQEIFVAVLFFAVCVFGRGGDLFSNSPRARNNAPLLQFAVSEKNFIRPIFLFAVVDKNELAPFAIRRRRLLFLRQTFLYYSPQPKAN